MGGACLKDKNITVSDGSVNIALTKAATPSFCTTYLPSTQYTAGALSTYTNWNQKYGAFEARVKYPDARKTGVWGGFWLTPVPGNGYNAWPDSGEIDIAEWWSKLPTYVLPTLHYTGSTINDSGLTCQMADPSGWHTHKLEWAPTEMKFFLDGQLCWTHTWDSSKYSHAGAPFDTPFAIDLSLGVPENPDPAVTFPQTYKVDYIRAWK